VTAADRGPIESKESKEEEEEEEAEAEGRGRRARSGVHTTVPKVETDR
jgi:hypothetical protein